MNNISIADIYAANDNTHGTLTETIASLNDNQLSKLPEGEKWTITQLVEHISLVDTAIVGICEKLLAAAEAAGKTSEGKAVISDNFLQGRAKIAGVKLEAPDFVQPNAGLPIEESLAKLEENRAAFSILREKFEHFDGVESKFPHPFLGKLSAHEWLALSGGHKTRHTEQIKRLAERIA